MNSVAIWNELRDVSIITKGWVMENPDERWPHELLGPDEFFQDVHKFCSDMASLTAHKETNMEWSIFVRAIDEIGQLITSILNEYSANRFMSCLVISRSAKELALTLWWALSEDALYEWREYSICKDIEGSKEIVSMLENGLSGKWEQAWGVNSRQDAVDGLHLARIKVDQLQTLKDGLPYPSGKLWGDLKKRWEPGSKEWARRLNSIQSEPEYPYVPWDDLCISENLMLNGYAHARSRVHDAALTPGDVMHELIKVMILTSHFVIAAFNGKFQQT